MKLYGTTWTRREIEARVGRIEQIGGVRRYRCSEGPEAGTEMIQVRTGGGLAYWVSPSKGLDISLAEYGGVPISWQSGNGDVHPAFYDAGDDEWLRTASGGLLMTCGLTQVGSPCAEAGRKFGLHGRIHHTPARHVSVVAEWLGDEYEMRIRGVMEETSIFGEQLRLTRTISSRLGDNRLNIDDTVENIGFQPCPHMMLYHVNFGFPLLAEHTVVELPAARVSSRDAAGDLDSIRTWQAPDPGWREQVYDHLLLPDAHRDKWPVVAIRNPDFPCPAAGTRQISAELSWDPATLPRFVQWRMPGAGVHALGIEPSNCFVSGRAEERSKGTLRMLGPGETVIYRLQLNIR
ncbi:hypothetical protein SD70_27030 [Gordoniibacillus kamchatkensis]|uniref:DUF4432 domain-containing protein n=1 Tax=Gordoniibacillus kamchatkensis TaxID=1590651 RepID=A0ABR5ABC5_9BACL|nr:aldose 1-epimerase family protein [Paenibacillus sp. VKM B-2647]KIL38329.1 hypothetical protein SD70_27030 [Paenibacillus sp. VKM B-2647]